MNLIIGIVLALTSAQVAFGQFRTYELQMDQLIQIDSPGGNSVNFTQLRVTKFNRTVYVGKAELEVLSSMENMQVAVFVSTMHGNEYKRRPFNINKQPFCNFWRNEFSTVIYDGLKPFTNLPAGDDCPFPQKKYWVKNYVFDEATTNLPPYISHGNYRLDIQFYENDVESGGFMFYMKSVKPGTQ